MISSLESPVVAEIWSDFGFCGVVFKSGWWGLVGVEIEVGGWVVGFVVVAMEVLWWVFCCGLWY